MKRSGLVAILVIIMALVASYLIFPEWYDFLIQPTRRQVFYRDYNEAAISNFEEQLLAALEENVKPVAPFSEHIYGSEKNNFYAGYEIDIAQGENLNASILSVDKNYKLLLELYDEENKLLQSAKLDDSLFIDFDNGKDQKLKLIIQSLEPLSSDLELKLYKTPEYIFPLLGKENGSIKSFWGASRDGGVRSHEGVDIFAVRDYPIVAVTSGRIASVRNRGLGGKQIWLSDVKNNQSLYYAHLNDWNVTSGERVEKGDTIGFVGNTGNARTTPPHLHFGIYKNGGAIDPKSFIWQTERPQEETNLPFNTGARGTGIAANLRASPSATANILMDVKTGQVHLLGSSGSWYHARTLDGKTGFMHESVIDLQ
ncbi:MAG: M23 family metallopeptidase [Nonlabens sp.]